MTLLLQKAFQKASQLPDTLQDDLAKQLIEELSWEEQWDSTLSNSQSTLDHLAKEAMQEYKAGKTTEMGFDEL